MSFTFDKMKFEYISRMPTSFSISLYVNSYLFKIYQYYDDRIDTNQIGQKKL